MGHGENMTKMSPLDDPRYAQFAWRRYWRLMRWMFAFTIVVTLIVLGLFYWQNGLVSIHFYIATAGAMIASLLLASSLMGLVFLSSGTGHDEAVEDPFEDEADR
jgi:magnesium-transporting ATPase (P-type)